MSIKDLSRGRLIPSFTIAGDAGCGVINWDVTLFVDRLPGAGEEVRVTRSFSVPGGKGANTAVAAARVLGASRVGMIGMLGSDDVAARQIRILEQEGVDTSCIARHEQAGSGTAYVIVDSRGEDMILTHMAANQLMTAKLVSGQKVLSEIGRASVIVVIDPPLDVAAALVAQGKASKTVIWSPALLTRLGFSSLHKHMSKADYIILNEQEARFLAGEGSGAQACLKLSRRLGGKKVVTTLGSRGCVFCWSGKKALIPTMKLASFGLKTVSTVGAGDAFVGTFGAFRARGLDDLESLFLANIAAALKTTREETRGSPVRDEIMRYRNDARIQSLFKKIRVT
jgi:ribokinase